jgi:hypothetical protein
MNTRNCNLIVAATLVIAFGTASSVDAHRAQSNGSINSRCPEILANPQGFPDMTVTYCRTTPLWVHWPPFPDNNYVYYDHYPYNGYGYTDASCAARFRSYNPATHTYTGHDGRPHHCP